MILESEIFQKSRDYPRFQEDFISGLQDFKLVVYLSRMDINELSSLVVIITLVSPQRALELYIYTYIMW